MELLVLGGGVHLERLGESVSVLRLPGESGGKPAGMRVHIEVIVLHL